LERWTPVLGLEDKYEISDHGRVRGLDRWRDGRWGNKVFVPGVEIKSRPNRLGYIDVRLGVGVKAKKHFTVHRLVLSSFAPVDGWQQLQVNHKDGDKANNRLENLEWCTAQENQLHARRVLLKQRGEKHGRAKLTDEQVRVIKSIAGRSQQSIADEYGVSQPVISAILRGKTWQTVQ
jgi:hypothetical protein